MSNPATTPAFPPLSGGIFVPELFAEPENEIQSEDEIRLDDGIRSLLPQNGVVDPLPPTNLLEYLPNRPEEDCEFEVETRGWVYTQKRIPLKGEMTRSVTELERELVNGKHAAEDLFAVELERKQRRHDQLPVVVLGEVVVMVMQEEWDRKAAVVQEVVDKKECNNEAVDKKTVVRGKVEEMKLERIHDGYFVFLAEVPFLCLLLLLCLPLLFFCVFVLYRL